jgi:hypothetical protein
LPHVSQPPTPRLSPSLPQKGHEIVATLAQSHLDPRALSAVCSILGSDGNVADANADAPCYLATVATWADKIRFRAHWSAPLHYAEGVSDHPPDNCQFPGNDGWAGAELANVLDAIHNVSSILTDFTSGSLASSFMADDGGSGAAEEALKFLIHFVGDMHQPLHLCGRDKGGNGDKVHWDGRVTSACFPLAAGRPLLTLHAMNAPVNNRFFFYTDLHTVWDDRLIAKAIRLTPAKYSKPISAPTLESSLRGAIYDPYVRRIYWEGLGADQQSGRWGSEADSWLSCPSTSSLEFDAFATTQPQEVLVGGVATAPRRKPLPGKGPPTTSDSDTLCPFAWAAPIQALNCGGPVWPPGIDDPQFATHDADDADEDDALAGRRAPRKQYLELDTPEYSGQIEKDWLVEKLLMQGGVRLAGILNAIFAPQQ